MDQTPLAKPNGGGVANGKSHTQHENMEAREKLMGDLKQAVQEAETWLRNAAAANSDDLGMVKAKFEDTLRTAKRDLLKLEDSMIARGKMAAQATDHYVHDNPWKSVATGAAIGVIVGLLIARR
ncbi:DUF883 family protein [Pseudoduganella eburnea]|uniref:DUF883 family protein n=1 Tax=Massilia eburnea TaxID=1776165 RepID=A0A6L6QJ97_9BURK|nr:DUF883 family protein [Massilia eburnea]MTW12538.1 DUF883 family protein [Massilia eburnea]